MKDVKDWLKKMVMPLKQKTTGLESTVGVILSRNCNYGNEKIKLNFLSHIKDVET